jgi:hypothetical protein
MANNIITLTKGDTFDFNISVYEDLYGNYYTNTKAGDRIVFRILLPHQSFYDTMGKDELTQEELYYTDAEGNIKYYTTYAELAKYVKTKYNKDLALFSDHIDLQDNNPNDECIFYIEHEDTLHMAPGVYYYTVKLIREATTEYPKQVVTIIDKTKFVLND